VQSARPLPLFPVFCSALALYVLTAGGSLTSTDAVATFALTSSIVDHHSIALPENVLGLDANRGVDGRFYSQYGIGQSLYNIPFYVAGRTVARLLPHPIGKPDTLLKAAVAMGSAVAAAITVVLIASLARRLGASPHGALISALSAAISSPLWPYSKFGFSTALTAAILAAAARLVVESQLRDRPRYAAAAGAVLAFGWLTRHEMALALVPLSAFLIMSARESRSRIPSQQIAALVGITCAGGLLWGWYNFVRFGSPFAVGYTPEFDGAGYAAFLISPAGSLLLFAPIAIVWVMGLAIGRFNRSTGMLLAGPLVIFYAFYGALADWPGGRGYGPRYLVPALVLLAPGAAALWDAGRHRRRIVVIACAIAAVLQLPGVLVDYAKVSTEWARTHTHEDVSARDWRISSSPFALGASAVMRAVPANTAYLTGLRQPPHVAPTSTADDRDFAQQLSFSLDFWWLYLVYLRAIRPLAAVAMALTLWAVAVVAARVAWRAG
jgi:hypothetical protein